MKYPDMPFPKRVLTAFVFSVGATLLVLGSWVSDAQAQDSQPSQQQKAMHYSLYYENFKNDDFQSAKSDLLWIVENAPGFPKGDDRNFERKFELYKGLAQQASTDEERMAYLDTAATVLSTAPQTMEEQGLSYEPFEWEILKGRFLQEYEDALPDLSSTALEDPVTHYRKAYDLAPTEINPYYIQQIIRSHVENGEQQTALSFANTVEQQRGDDEEVRKILSSVRSDIFGKNPQAQVAYLEEQFEANPDSLALMEELFNAYVEQGNTSNASELAPKLMEEDIPAETIREIAQMRIEDGRPKAAIQAYEKLTSGTDASLTAEDYFRRGRAYEQMDQLSKARAQFRKAIEARSDYGRAYIAIGDLYTTAVSDCSGSELSRSDKAVYWAAVDKYQKAKEVDSAVSSTANSKINTYRKYFPTQEDIFYRDEWDEGGSFMIDYGCYSWIGETTTVRRSSS